MGEGCSLWWMECDLAAKRLAAKNSSGEQPGSLHMAANYLLGIVHSMSLHLANFATDHLHFGDTTPLCSPNSSLNNSLNDSLNSSLKSSLNSSVRFWQWEAINETPHFEWRCTDNGHRLHFAGDVINNGRKETASVGRRRASRRRRRPHHLIVCARGTWSRVFDWHPQRLWWVSAERWSVA